MKILMFSDTHFKLTSSIPPFNKLVEDGITYELQRGLKSIDFVKDVVEEKKPDLVIHLGDVFHLLHTNQNIVIASAVNKLRELYDVVKSVGADLYYLAGNHDYVNERISMIDVCPADKHIKKPYQQDAFYFLPFYEPEYQMISELQRLKNKGCIGVIFTHALINGFKFNLKKEIDNGAYFDDIDKFVFSGHIHIPQMHNSVVYVGSLYQNLTSEKSIDIPNGVCIFDSSEGSIDFIENTYVGGIEVVYLSNCEKVESLKDSVSAVKVVNDISDKEEAEELLNYVISYLQEAGIMFWIVKFYDLKNIESKKKVIVDLDLSPDDIMKMYIKNKYPEIEPVYGKYFKTK